VGEVPRLCIPRHIPTAGGEEQGFAQEIIVNRFISMVALVVCMLVTFTSATFAQEINKDPGQLHQNWHDPSLPYRPLGDWRLEAEVSGGIADLVEDENSSDFIAAEIKLSRYMFDFCGSMSVFGGLKVNGYKLSAPGRILDREEVTAELTLDAISHPDSVNHRLAYRLGFGLGGGYQDWNGERGLFVASTEGELAYQIQGLDVGPFAGFDGRMALGENNTHSLIGTVRFGMRYVPTPIQGQKPPVLAEARLYGLVGGSTEEATDSGVRLGNWKGKNEVELDTQFVGLGTLVRLANFVLTLEGGLVNSYVHTKDPSGDHESWTEDGLYAQASLHLAF
jgi:hypothetical protein